MKKPWGLYSFSCFVLFCFSFKTLLSYMQYSFGLWEGKPMWSFFCLKMPFGWLPNSFFTPVHLALIVLKVLDEAGTQRDIKLYHSIKHSLFSLMHGLLDLGGVTVGISGSVCPGIAGAIGEPRWRPSSTGPHGQTCNSLDWEKIAETWLLEQQIQLAWGTADPWCLLRSAFHL